MCVVGTRPYFKIQNSLRKEEFQLKFEFDSILVTEEIEKFLRVQSTKQTWAVLTVPITATLLKSYQENEHAIEPKLLLQNKSKRVIEALSLISWYLPEEIRFYLQIELLAYLEKQPYCRSKLILRSKAFAILVCQDILMQKGPRYLFGRYLEKELFSSLPFTIKVTEVKESVAPIPEKRRIGVGYRDKGQQPNLAKGGALSGVFNKPLQQKIEENRKIQEDLQKLYEGFIY